MELFLKLEKRILFLIIPFFVFTGLSASSVSGFIRSHESGEPLPYANVVLIDKKTGTQSNAK